MISNSSPVPQWCSDAMSTLLVDVNDAALRMWRYERDKFIGMPATSLLCEEEVSKQLEAVKMNQWGETGPWKCRRADGTVLYLKVRWHQAVHQQRLCDCVYVIAVGESLHSLRPCAAQAASASTSS